MSDESATETFDNAAGGRGSMSRILPWLDTADYRSLAVLEILEDLSQSEAAQSTVT